MQSGRRRPCNARKATWAGAIARVPVQSGVVEDPTARLETSCTRTGRPRRRLWRTFTGRTAGEGSGHTARMYVSEESHCGILPMNHSNNDGTLSAESEEGRPRLKENTFPFDTYPTPSGTARVPRWVSVRTTHKIGRYLSERRTGCAKERPSGSVRGVSRK